MNRSTVLLFIVLSLPIIMYAVNPYRTATFDLRARLFGYASYSIPSGSMTPALMPGDYISVNAMAYTFSSPQTNDVVVFKYPQNREIEYVMRVVATEGDVVSILEGRVVVNGEPINQSYVLDTNNTMTKNRITTARTVPPGMLFVLGDNRDNSNDSRYWGFVPNKDVIGRVSMIWMSEDADRIWTRVQ